MTMLRGVMAMSVLAGCMALGAQTTAAPVPFKLKAAGPTVKVLAIGRLTVEKSPELMKVMEQEVPDTLALYLDGKIDQWYSRKDANGVVFVMNATSVDEARAILEKLPLGVKKMMSFDLIPLAPLSPLHYFLDVTGAAK